MSGQKMSEEVPYLSIQIQQQTLRIEWKFRFSLVFVLVSVLG